MKNVLSCQTEQNEIYTFINSEYAIEVTKYRDPHDSQNLRRVRKNLPKLQPPLQFFSLAKVDLSESKVVIVLSGGRSKADYSSSACYAYSINDREWAELPNLVMARESHSSCSIGSSVYVFGGHDGAHDLMNAVELLHLNPNGIGEQQDHWQLISTNGSFEPRMNPVVCAIDDDVILLSGGFDNDVYFSDILLFNTITQ